MLYQSAGLFSCLNLLLIRPIRSRLQPWCGYCTQLGLSVSDSVRSYVVLSVDVSVLQNGPIYFRIRSKCFSTVLLSYRCMLEDERLKLKVKAAKALKLFLALTPLQIARLTSRKDQNVHRRSFHRPLHVEV